MMDKEVLFYHEIDSPLGSLLLAASSRGVCHIAFGSWLQTQEEVESWACRILATNQLQYRRDPAKLNDTETQLNQYFSGIRRNFDLTLDMRGTQFQQRVWTALQRIPFGTVQTYRDIAIEIGSGQAVRAVGNANRCNPLSIVVPCHRVISSSGQLHGYAGGIDKKKYLLELEGWNRTK